MLSISVVPNTAAIPPNTNGKLSKTVVNFFKFCQIVLSFDLGFFDYTSFRMKFFWRFIAMLQSIILCSYFEYYFLYNLDFANAFIQSVAVIQYFMIICFVTLPSGNANLYNFCNTIFAIDAELKFYDSNVLTVKLLFSVLISALLRIILIFIYCYGYSQYCFNFVRIFFLLISFLSCDTILIIYFFIFYCCFQRLTKLSAVLNERGTNITYSQYVYITLVNITEKVKSRFDNAVSTNHFVVG